MQDIAILEVQDRLILDISPYAGMFENACEGHLLPAPKGIYLNGTLEPVMVDGQAYYTYDRTETIPMTDINKNDRAVYNEAGKCVITSLQARRKAFFLSNEPFLPYRGIKIVETMVNDQIDSFVLYRRNRRNLFSELTKQFAPGVDVNDQFGNDLESIYKDLQSDVANFLNNHSWNLYFARMKNNMLHIERSLDYRAYCWEQEHGDAYRNGTYKLQY